MFSRKIDQLKGAVLFPVLLLLSISSYGQTINYAGPQNYVVSTAIPALSPSISGFTAAVNGQTATFSGNGTIGYTDGSATTASFNQPLGAAVDAAGNIYIADAGSHLIRKVSSTGTVTTIAGTANTHGFSNVAPGSFWHPVGLAVDASGNLYIADEDNNAIRKITPGGVISTVAGSGTAGDSNGTAGQPLTATFNLPCGVAVDGSGNLYVTDNANNQIRKITASGTVSIFAGNAAGTAGSSDGLTTAAYFNHPFGITIDGSGNLYVTDRSNNMIRRITPAGQVTTLAGATTAGFADNANGLNARFNVPTSIAADASGNVYVTDEVNQRIRMITPAGAVTTLSGTGTQGAAMNGLGSVAVFNNPFGLAIGATGFLYVGDYSNSLLRTVAMSKYSITPALPAGLSFAPSTGTISGMPTAVSAATNYTINGYYSTNYATTTLSIAVSQAGSINPSSGQNYIATYSPRQKGFTTSAAIYPVDNDRTQIQTTIQYFDGLGRPLQTVQARGSFGGNDMVQPVAYDPMGREANKYLPYANKTTVVSDGSYKSDALTQQGNFYSTSTAWATGTVRTAYPVAGATYEPSPENRVTEQGFAGQSWQLSGLNITGGGHTKKITYGTNTSAETIMLWIVNSNYNGATGTSNYAANTLYKVTATDENQNSTIEYKDKSGNVVCKKVQSGASSYLTTYYIYDDLGNLSYVIPPLPSTAVNGNPVVAMPTSFVETDNVFLSYMYGYHYDGRDRMTAKKMPGRSWQYMV
jgi:sugar lactone lactonase YvrE